MIDQTRVLQPLREADRSITTLQDYESTAELASAVRDVHSAVQRSLRYLLRADADAPDDLRLAALSPTDMAPDRLIPALRQRNLISLDLAGQIHELDAAAERANRDAVRASDGDLALRVVDQLRAQVQGLGERSVRAAAHGTVEAGALTEVHSVPSVASSSRMPRRIIPILIGALLLGVVLWLIIGRKSETSRGVTYFEQSKYSEAEKSLRSAVDKDPGDATAAYYLAILYRRSQRFDEASTVLRRAIEKNPQDAPLREELGNLFMVLAKPDLAAKQYRTAETIEPKQSRYWVKLVQALRAAGDPEADAVAEQAPEEARAMLRTGK